MTDYSIGDVIGRGLVGPLRAARYMPTGMDVNVEDIPAELAADAVFTDRLAVAGKAAAAFRHPAAVAVFDLIDDRGTLRLVTGNHSGASLVELAPATVPAPDALVIADRVLEVLGAAHAEGLVHGGVSRQAVAITRACDVRLCGFGLAAALYPDTAGDPSCDLADAARLTAALLGISLDERATVPEGLRPVRNVLRRAASPDPRHRYRSAATMRRSLRAAASRSLGADWEARAALDRIARVPGTEVSGQGLPSARPERGARRRLPRRTVAVAASLAAGVLVGLMVTAARGVQPPPATPVALTGPLSLTVTPHAGSCGSEFTVRASAAVRGDGTLVYRWERSDGGTTADVPLRITSADSSFAVRQSWFIPGNQTSPPWITFEVLSPARISTSASIDDTCP